MNSHRDRFMLDSIPLNGGLRPDLPSTHYLDNRIYSDHELYARERSEIFGKQWKFVCHESEVPNTRDFRQVSVAEQDIIILRGDDDEIRAFHNVCPHRGSKILRTIAGNLPQDRMTCFYHMWSFNTRGECLNISQDHGYEGCGVGEEGTSLREIRLHNLHGLLFICLDENTAELEEYLGAQVMAAMAIPWSSEVEVFHIHRQEIKANWKLFVETNCEGYHELLHTLNRTTALSTKGYKDRQWHVHPHGHVWMDQALISYDRYADIRRDDVTFPGMQENGHTVVDVFPDTMLNCRASTGRIDTLIPMGPSKTILECRGFGLKGDTPEVREKRIKHHNQVWGPTGTNLPEDVWAVEVQMENMVSGNSKYSVIAREEEGAMSDAPLRGFYEVWRRLIQSHSHDIDEPFNVQ